MPILEVAMRQRKRTIQRVWTPQQPELLTAQIGGTIYVKKFPKIPLEFNKVMTPYESIPYGFSFSPLPDVQWVPLTDLGGIAVDVVQAALISGDIPPLNLTGVSTINQPGTITPEQAAAIAGNKIPTPVSLLRLIPTSLAVGLTSTPCAKTSIVVAALTIQANAANLGTIWLTGGQGQPAGQGFPLAPGAGILLGDVMLRDKVIDLSSVFVIGTDPADSINIIGQA